MPQTFTIVLVAWIGLACPVLCGLRFEVARDGSAGGSNGAQRDCCGRPVSGDDLPTEPRGPVERLGGECFCVGLFVVTPTADLDGMLLVAAPSPHHVASDWAIAEYSLREASPTLCCHSPPAPARLSPLLI